MQRKFLFTKGNVSLVTTAIVAGATVVASVITSWGFASTKVSVIEERENNHYLEVQKQLGSIEKKLDDVIAGKVYTYKK